MAPCEREALLVASGDIRQGACNRVKSPTQGRVINKLALVLLSIILLELVLIGHQVQPVKAIKKKIYLKKLKKLLPLLALIKPKKKIILLPIPIPMNMMKGSGGNYGGYYANTMMPTQTPAFSLPGRPSYGGGQPLVSPSAQSMFMTFVSSQAKPQAQHEEHSHHQQPSISYAALASQHDTNDETGQLYYSSPTVSGQNRLHGSARLAAYTQRRPSEQVNDQVQQQRQPKQQHQQPSQSQQQQPPPGRHTLQAQSSQQSSAMSIAGNMMHSDIPADHRGYRSTGVEIVDAMMHSPANDDSNLALMMIDHELDQMASNLESSNDQLASEAPNIEPISDDYNNFQNIAET